MVGVGDVCLKLFAGDERPRLRNGLALCQKERSRETNIAIDFKTIFLKVEYPLILLTLFILYFD